MGDGEYNKKRVVIIGAGVGGLAAARRCAEYGFQCEVFEMTGQLGGTWVYTDQTGNDMYGDPIHSSMYQDLRTNIPKEAMGFPGFPFPEQKRSYITHTDTLEYINSFADNFNLRPLIKFDTVVTEVRPSKNDTWQVSYRHRPTKEKSTAIYDAVIVCSGHYSDPNMPEIDGKEHFRGNITHSHSYRRAENFRDKRVLVVGAGPSGIDIALQLEKEAEYIVLSHHASRNVSVPVLQKPDMKCIGNNGEVIFEDNTSDVFDDIILCTGYLYTFPFLHESCSITVEDNYVQPLYKHLINIERPSMAFLGVPFQITPFPISDLQVRYFLNLLNGSFQLPDKEVMRRHTQWDLQRRLDRGWPKRKAHQMGDDYEYEYCQGLAKEGMTKCLPHVINKLRAESRKNQIKNLTTYREHNFRVIDDEDFVDEFIH